jgi:hypothetical protein
MAKLKSNSIRIFVTLWLCSILIITVGWVVMSWKNNSFSTNVFSYSGGLISVLTVPLVPIPINSISELADYPLPVSSFSDTFYKLANQSLDSNLQKIANDYIVHYDFDQAITNASSSKVVMAESKQLLEYIVR